MSRDIFPTNIGRWLGLEHVMLKLKCERSAKWMEDEMAQSEVSPALLTVSQMEQGAELLARVFQHDPMIQYLVADSARLLDKPLRLYQAAIRMALLSGEVHTTPGINGMAVWISPGHTDFTFGQLLRSGFLTATLSMGLKSLAKFMQSAGYVENLKKRTITDPH